MSLLRSESIVVCPTLEFFFLPTFLDPSTDFSLKDFKESSFCCFFASSHIMFCISDKQHII